jgi:hypothetical protein
MKFSKQSLIIWASLTLIFLPIRLVFYNLVSTNWYGSFGLMSIISVILIILVKKNKLGRWGIMFENEMRKVQFKKRRYLVYGSNLFTIFLLLNFIAAINLGDTEFKHTQEDLQKQMEQNAKGQKVTLNLVMEQYKEHSPQEYLIALLGIIFVYFTHYDIFAGFMAIENNITGGYYLHFTSVFLIEQIEVLGVLLFYRHIFKNEPAVKV